ncbi:hypothetical protein HDU98_003746 [Podochytrium sp. JEL0797]|nr:hypothetical protein HDU98_003746 [Podochytrium sp. JEL0797]
MNRFVSSGTVLGAQEVHDPSAPALPPPEAYIPPDTRTLYEKLQTNKLIKEEEFAAKTRLANLIKKLDPDEIEFLNTQQDDARAGVKEREDAVKKELAEFRLKSLEMAEERVTQGLSEDPAKVAAASFGGGFSATLKKKKVGGIAGIEVVRKGDGKKDVGEGKEVGKSIGITGQAAKGVAKRPGDAGVEEASSKKSKTAAAPPPKPTNALLVSAYGSDSDSEED